MPSLQVHFCRKRVFHCMLDKMPNFIGNLHLPNSMIMSQRGWARHKAILGSSKHVVGTSNTISIIRYQRPNQHILLPIGTYLDLSHYLGFQGIKQRANLLGSQIFVLGRNNFTNPNHWGISSWGNNLTMCKVRQPPMPPNTNQFPIPNSPNCPFINDIMNLQNTSPCIGTFWVNRSIKNTTIWKIFHTKHFKKKFILLMNKTPHLFY